VSGNISHPKSIAHSHGQGCAEWSPSTECAGNVALLVKEALIDLTAIARDTS